MKEICHKKGEIVVCDNGHEVADIINDLHRGDYPLSSFINNFRPNQKIPNKGDPFPMKCWCGAIWLNGTCSPTKMKTIKNNNE